MAALDRWFHYAGSTESFRTTGSGHNKEVVALYRWPLVYTGSTVHACIIVYVQCAKLSVLIFRKMLRDNPKVLASFVRSGLDEKDAQFIEEMIDNDGGQTFNPKV